MSRTPIIAANWKMHKTHTDAIQFAQKLHYLLEIPDYERQEIVICPPFTALRSLQTLFDADKMAFRLGAQDTFYEEKGAFTGAISPVMLAALDCTYVICGHSERRQIFGETDEIVNKKVAATFENEMTPILAVGETLDERRAGDAEAKCMRQLQGGLAGIAPEDAARIVIAYEPIWAIGTGEVATPDDAQAMCGAVRSELANIYSPELADVVRIQYGGSVKAGNVESLMAMPDIDGGLVGGASLDPDEFGRILTVW